MVRHGYCLQEAYILVGGISFTNICVWPNVSFVWWLDCEVRKIMFSEIRQKSFKSSFRRRGGWWGAGCEAELQSVNWILCVRHRTRQFIFIVLVNQKSNPRRRAAKCWLYMWKRLAIPNRWNNLTSDHTPNECWKQGEWGAKVDFVQFHRIFF